MKSQTTIDVGSSEKDFMTTVSNVAEVPNRNSERCLCPCSGYIAAVFFCVVFSIATIALIVFCFMKRKRRNERYKGKCKSCFKDMSKKVAVSNLHISRVFQRLITLILRKNYNRINLSTKSIKVPNVLFHVYNFSNCVKNQRIILFMDILNALCSSEINSFRKTI